MSISISAISASTLSSHILLGFPTGLLPSTLNSEKDLTRKERATLAQLRSGYCKLLGFYKSRIKKENIEEGSLD